MSSQYWVDRELERGHIRDNRQTVLVVQGWLNRSAQTPLKFSSRPKVLHHSEYTVYVSTSESLERLVRSEKSVKKLYWFHDDRRGLWSFWPVFVERDRILVCMLGAVAITVDMKSWRQLAKKQANHPNPIIFIIFVLQDSFMRDSGHCVPLMGDKYRFCELNLFNIGQYLS